jgi:hypothetical protein
MRSKKISLNHVEMAYIYKPKDTLISNKSIHNLLVGEK